MKSNAGAVAEGGAYQEILGDMHNLFGDTDSVNVELAPDDSHALTQPQRGDTVDSVLRYMRFNPSDLLRANLTSKQRESFFTELKHRTHGLHLPGRIVPSTSGARHERFNRNSR